MLRGVVSRGLVTGAVVTGTVLGVAGPAWAPKYIFGASAYGTCVVAGEPDSLFNGDFTAMRFTSSGGRLYVTASVGGACVDGTEVVATVPTVVATFPVESVTTECSAETAVVEIRPGSATLRDVRLDLYPSTVLDVIWMPGDQSAERAKLCAVHRAAERGPQPRLVVSLNQLLRI